MTTQPKPTAGAMKAAEAIAKWNNTGTEGPDTIHKGDLPSLALIIDREAVAPLVETLADLVYAVSRQQEDKIPGSISTLVAHRLVEAQKALSSIQGGK